MKTFFALVAALTASSVSAQYHGNGAMVRIECDDLSSTCGYKDVGMLHKMVKSCAATKLQLEHVCADSSVTDVFPFKEHNLKVHPGFDFGRPGPLDANCDPSCDPGGGTDCTVACLFFECAGVEGPNRMLRQGSDVRKLQGVAAPFEHTCSQEIEGFTRNGDLAPTCVLSASTCSFSITTFEL
jgi:hypothetical protein